MKAFIILTAIAVIFGGSFAIIAATEHGLISRKLAPVFIIILVGLVLALLMKKYGKELDA